MYTKEKFESAEYLRLYKYVGSNCLKTLIRVEEILSKRKRKSDLNIHLEKESFVTRDNTMHYTNSVHLNSDGTYLRSNVTKEIGSNLLDISLELGVEGFDYSTGERYDRKQARVEYTFENDKVDLKKVEDENFYIELEENRNKEISERITTLKK